MSPPIGLSPVIFEPDSSIQLPTRYPNLWQWLRPSIVITSGSNVTDIPDQSGLSNNAQNVTSSPSPTIGATINGQPVITFPTSINGAAMVLSIAPVTFNSCTIFAVIKPSSLSGFYGVYDHNTNVSWGVALNVGATAWKFAMNVGSPPYGLCEGGVPAIGTTQLLTAIFVGSTHTATLQVNGVTVSTDTSMTAPTSISGAGPVALGGRPNVSVDGIAGEYGEAAIYTDAKTGSDLINLNRYFGNLYGIPGIP